MPRIPPREPYRHSCLGGKRPRRRRLAHLAISIMISSGPLTKTTICTVSRTRLRQHNQTKPLFAVRGEGGEDHKKT